MVGQRLLSPVAVVVKKLLVRLDVPGGEEDEPWCTVDDDRFRGQVCLALAMVDQSAHPAGFRGCIDAERDERYNEN